MAFLKEAAAAVGADPSKVKGHSARIWGARRLARRGLEIGAIQVFCRWGARMVLHYLQDAALASQHAVLAKRPGRLGTVDLQAQVDEALSQSAWDKKVVGFVSAAVSNQLAEKLWSAPVGGPAWPKAAPPWANDLSRRIDEVVLDLGLVAGLVEPRFIKCCSDRGGRGKVHAVLSKGKAVCGWSFIPKAVRPVPAACWDAPPRGVSRCDKCLGL